MEGGGARRDLLGSVSRGGGLRRGRRAGSSMGGTRVSASSVWRAPPRLVGKFCCWEEQARAGCARSTSVQCPREASTSSSLTARTGGAKPSEATQSTVGFYRALRVDGGGRGGGRGRGWGHALIWAQFATFGACMGSMAAEAPSAGQTLSGSGLCFCTKSEIFFARLGVVLVVGVVEDFALARTFAGRCGPAAGAGAAVAEQGERGRVAYQWQAEAQSSDGIDCWTIGSVAGAKCAALVDVVCNSPIRDDL